MYDSFKKKKESPGKVIKLQEHDSLWVARNEEGDLWLFSKRHRKGYEDVPHREIWCCSSLTPFYRMYKDSYGCALRIDDDMFPEVTYENSPKKLIIG